MQRVFVAEHPIEAKMVLDLLESAGIESVVRGDHLFGIRGGVPLTADTLPSVWVVHDEDAAEAVELLERQASRARLESLDGLGEGVDLELAGDSPADESAR